jgi:hypothetical protein
LRIKEQETHLTLQEHDDDDDKFICSTSVSIYSYFVAHLVNYTTHWLT